MSYELGFRSEALTEWSRLDGGIRVPFKKKRAERLVNPRIPSAELASHRDRYKIDQRSAGSRLVYEIDDAQIIVVVVAVGRGDRAAVYAAAARR